MKDRSDQSARAIPPPEGCKEPFDGPPLTVGELRSLMNDLPDDAWVQVIYDVRIMPGGLYRQQADATHLDAVVGLNGADSELRIYMDETLG